MNRLILVPILLMLPVSAVVAQDCKHSAPRALQLDLAGVEAVEFQVGRHELRLRGSAGAAPALQGRACASSEKLLESLELTTGREGSTLVVRMEEPRTSGFSLFGQSYAHLELEGTLPDDIAVRVRTGSGDVHVSGVRSLDATVGSGDLEGSDAGRVELGALGSGDVELVRIQSLRVGSVGSGDLQARHIAGDVDIGSVGSGDVELSDVGGRVEVGSIGSGDLEADRVRGGLRVRTLGSGDVDHSDVAGAVEIDGKVIQRR